MLYRDLCSTPVWILLTRTIGERCRFECPIHTRSSQATDQLLPKPPLRHLVAARSLVASDDSARLP